MKKLLATWMVTLVFALTSGTAFPIAFCKDIASTDPTDKTFDDEWTIIGLPGTITVDIWINDVPEPLACGGFWFEYDQSMVSVASVKFYDNDDLPGPWDPQYTQKVDQPYPGAYMGTVCNLPSIPPDIDGDFIIARIEFHCLDAGDTTIEFTNIVGGGGIIGQSLTEYILPDNEITFHQIPIDGDNDGIPYSEDNCPEVFNPDQTDTDGDCLGDLCDGFPDNYDQTQPDTDGDGCGDACDNCPVIPNGPDLGICMDGSIRGVSCTTHEDCGMNGFCESYICEYGTIIGTSCTSDEDCGVDGNCSLDQDDYVCSCVSNFDCDCDVDGTDAVHFKMHFGRSPYNNLCTNESLCDGDFDCDCDVDGTDAAQFKNGFGRGCFGSADYSASCMGACLSCVDGIYAYTCTYEQ